MQNLNEARDTLSGFECDDCELTLDNEHPDRVCPNCCDHENTEQPPLSPEKCVDCGERL